MSDNGHAALSPAKVECCPPLERGPICDRLDFRYRLPWRVADGRVDLILHFRLERCSGPMALGDLAYSTTLFPGERVRLFTSDRHSRWTYDADTALSYRHETTSEESYYTWGMARSMSDLTVSESGSVSNQVEEDWSSGGGGASVNLFGIIEIGGGGGGGSFDAESTSQFARNLATHAESSSSYVAAGVRARTSTSVGEVQTRSHAEGESESHLESSSRTFTNPNRCHAVTYFFYRLMKKQTVRWRLVAIQRVYADPAAPTTPDRQIGPDLTGKVQVRPQVVLATGADRLQKERIAREAALERERTSFGGRFEAAALRSAVNLRQPTPVDQREKALKAVDTQLQKAGLIEANGDPTDRIVAAVSWEREEWLPTPGLLVKGCLDECGTCEHALQREIELDLERKSLENRLMERKIELLEKAQEYRCCPADEEEDEGDDS